MGPRGGQTALAALSLLLCAATAAGQLPRPLPMCSRDFILPAPDNVVAPPRLARSALKAAHVPYACRTISTNVGDLSPSANARAAPQAPSRIVVKVVWHVVTTKRLQYDLKFAEIVAALDGVTKAFNHGALRGTSYRFELSTVRRWTNDKFAAYGMCAFGGLRGARDRRGIVFSTRVIDAVDLCFYQAIGYIRKNSPRVPASTLVVVSANMQACRTGGFSTLPNGYSSNPGFDGVYLSSGLPAAIRPFYWAHEVGHWLGLLHTFQLNGRQGSLKCSPRDPKNTRCCDYVDDLVGDTPKVNPTDGRLKANYFRCISRGDTRTKAPDSCPSDPGRDLVNNYMDYVGPSNRNCVFSFTPGQHRRMRSQWAQYRMRA